MALSPQTVDLLITTIIEAVAVLAKLSKGEELTEADMRLETWQETVDRVKAEIKV